MFPGVPEWRLDRLLRHLWKVESEIGPLEKPFWEPLPTHCPIGRYCPSQDREGRPFEGPFSEGIRYRGKRYTIYRKSDATWWIFLGGEARLQILKWLDKLLFDLD